MTAPGRPSRAPAPLPPAGSGAPCATAVHLLRLPAPDDSRLQAEGILDQGELARWRRLIQIGDRQRLVGSRFLAKAVLGRLLGQRPSAVTIGRAPSGRPQLAATPALRLSLSHSGPLVALAVGAEDLGVDVEAALEVAGGADAWRLAETAFSRAEAQALARLPLAQRPRAFLALWTAKEALAKASGRPLDEVLTTDLSAVLATGGARAGGAQEAAWGPGVESGGWLLQRLDGWPGCLLSLARPARQHADQPRVTEWSQSDLSAIWMDCIEAPKSVRDGAADPPQGLPGLRQAQDLPLRSL